MVRVAFSAVVRTAVLKEEGREFGEKDCVRERLAGEGEWMRGEEGALTSDSLSLAPIKREREDAVARMLLGCRATPRGGRENR